MTDQPTDPTHGLSVQHADALWDAVAIPGPRPASFPAQHERVCRAVAGILAELTAVPEEPPADRTDDGFTAADLVAALRSAGEERDKLHQEELAELRRKLAASERIRENADFHLGQEMARRQRAEKEAADRAAEIERMRERHMTSLRRADEINNSLMEEVQRYAAGTERPVLWSVYNRMHQRALTAEAEANRLRRMADEPQPECAASTSGNCLREQQSETACDTDAGECAHGGRPAAEPEPTPLRWGLDDVLYGDDESVTVLLSGPASEPYRLELDPERAAALRDSLTGPDETQQPDAEEPHRG